MAWRSYSNRLELYYRATPKGGDLTVAVDGSKPQRFSTRADVERDAWRVFELGKPGRHEAVVKAAGGGPVHIYGATLERNNPGVVYDAVPLIGARGSRLLNFDAEHLKAQVAHRAPDLIIASFGGNELVERKMNLTHYERQYTDALQRLLAGRPGASCLITSPPDHGVRVRGRVVTDPLLLKIMTAQRRIAADLGCAYFDAIAAMGGVDAVARGVRRRPATWYKDLTHLTPAGDELLGTELYRALVDGYQSWLAERR